MVVSKKEAVDIPNKRGDAVAAESLFREALELHHRAGSEQTLRVANLQLALAEFLQQTGRIAEAEPYFRSAADIARRELPADSHELERFVANE